MILIELFIANAIEREEGLLLLWMAMDRWIDFAVVRYGRERGGLVKPDPDGLWGIWSLSELVRLRAIS